MWITSAIAILAVSADSADPAKPRFVTVLTNAR